ncbi:MAG: hypothetical protein GWP91_18965, partial [Rhodobacterales bacterium]|nr:hypothetical protein [Rhodobacterales bacterium]
MQIGEHFYEAQLAGFVLGKRWLVAMDNAVVAARFAGVLLSLGAEGCFVLAGTRGTGDLPDLGDTPFQVLDIKGQTTMEAIRAVEAGFAALSDEILGDIEEWDPSGEALALCPIFSTGRDVAGRKVFGRRPAAWQALEDKVVIDAIWDLAGIKRAPFQVVPANLSALQAAAAQIDTGGGTVWAGDAIEGFNGGAEYTRWVTSPKEAEETAEFLSSRCNRARVMPFLEGVPCSIHGLVFADDVVVLRPCEMVVLRNLSEHKFAYARAASFWDPGLEHTATMREAARRMGVWLRAEHSYRGAFTLDGVLTTDGFLPTELNPRFGAALSVLAGGLEGLHLMLLNFAMVHGCEFDWRPRDLERLILDYAVEHPSGGGSMTTTRVVLGQQKIALIYKNSA